jgi:hypothetical protein
MTVNLSCFAGVGQQLFDNNGIPLAGGLIYSYLAGTNTPATTYTSSSGSIAQSNPIVLDSAGRVPSGEIWVTPDQLYKYVVKTATGTLLNTYDNIPSITSIGDLTSPILTPLMFGAKGDGVTNDTTAMNAMFAAAAGRTIDGLAKSYKVVPDVIVDPYATAGVGYGLNKAWFCVYNCVILQNMTIVGSTTFGSPTAAYFLGKQCAINSVHITGDCRFSSWYSAYTGVTVSGTSWFGGDYPVAGDFVGFYFNTFRSCQFGNIICDQRYGPVNSNQFVECQWANWWVKNTGYVGYSSGHNPVQSFHMNQMLSCEVYCQTGNGITAPDGNVYAMVIGDSLGNGVTSGGVNRIIGLYNETTVRGVYGDSWQIENTHFSGESSNTMGGGQIGFNIPYSGEPAPLAGEARVAPQISPNGNVLLGGDWSVLNESGYPACFYQVSMSASVVSDSTEPTGLGKAVQFSSSVAFAVCGVTNSVSDNGNNYTPMSYAVIYKVTSGDASIEVFQPGASTFLYGSANLFRLSNGWIMATGMTGGLLRFTSANPFTIRISAVSMGRGAAVTSPFTNQASAKPMLDLSGGSSVIGNYVAKYASWGNTGVKTVSAASSTDWYTIDFGAFNGKAATVKVVANYASSAGGARCAVRESLINENGSGTLVEQNITNITGVNMTLSFVLAGALLTVRTTTAAGTSETARVGIQVIGGGMGNSQVTIL